MLVFRTSWTRLQDMSWRRLQNVFSVTNFRLQDVLKTSWKKKNCYTEHVFKTSCKKSWRQTKCLLGIYVLKKSNCVSNKSIFHKSLTNLRLLQNPLNRTQRFWYSSQFETHAAFLFKELKSLMTVRCCWNQLNSNSTLQNKWGNKNDVLGNILHKYIQIINRLYSHLYLHLKSIFTFKKILQIC